jgi:hypothetical protein
MLLSQLFKPNFLAQNLYNIKNKLSIGGQMLIGLAGKASSGKDTVADYFVKNYGFKKISLAEPLKRIVKDVFVLDDFTVYNRVAREQPLSQWNNWSVRKLLQFIGTELFRKNIDENVWVKSLLFRVQNDLNNNYVVPDCRFPNEIEYLKNNFEDFLSIKTIRQGCNGQVGLSNHESEAYDLITDYTINNDGTLEELWIKADDIFKTAKLKKSKEVV